MTCIKLFGVTILVFLSIITISESFSRCQKTYQPIRYERASTKLSLSPDDNKIVKKFILPLLISSVLLISAPLVSNAYWNESGEWIELKESGFSEVWGDRLKKAVTMSPSDIFMAAKGAGNTDKRYHALL